VCASSITVAILSRSPESSCFGNGLKRCRDDRSASLALSSSKSGAHLSATVLCLWRVSAMHIYNQAINIVIYSLGYTLEMDQSYLVGVLEYEIKLKDITIDCLVLVD
jgi:hypothetical protein